MVKVCLCYLVCWRNTSSSTIFWRHFLILLSVSEKWFQRRREVIARFWVRKYFGCKVGIGSDWRLFTCIRYNYYYQIPGKQRVLASGRVFGDKKYIPEPGHRASSYKNRTKAIGDKQKTKKPEPIIWQPHIRIGQSYSKK